MIRLSSTIWLCLWCAVSCAQSSPEDVRDSAPASDESLAVESESESQSTLFVRDENGRWVAVEESSREAAPSESNLSPPAYIAKLQFDGEVDGNHAVLTASIRVEITRDESWYELPLALDQALIYDHSYEGDGTAAPALPRGGQTGVRWQFKGVGSHRLTIHFLLPLKSTIAGRQLQLSLPTLPTNYIAQAVLRVPDARIVTTDPSPNVTLRSRVLDSGKTELECDISGTRWDLGWRTPAADEPPLTQVRTLMQVRRDPVSLRLIATQECNVEQGAVSELIARLPSDFEFDSVQLKRESVEPIGDGPRVLTKTEVPTRPGWVRVELGAELQGVFELEWRLSRRFPSGGGRVVVDGLSLEGARRQGGTIEVEAVDGYTAHEFEDGSRDVRRVDGGEYRPGEPVYDLRFQYQQQPFQLEYELKPVNAIADADSETFLLIDAERNDLFLDIHLEVMGGQVQEIVIDWPNHAAVGWEPAFSVAEVIAEGVSERVAGTLDVDAQVANQDQLRLQLSRPCRGSLRTMLQFTRKARSTETLELILPKPDARHRKDQTLTLANAVSLETAETMDGKELPQVPRNGAWPSELPSEFEGGPTRTYSLPSNAPPVEIEWSQQQRTIAAETRLNVELLGSSAVAVSQEIAYDVAYGYVKFLLLDPGQLARSSTSEEPESPVGLGSDADLKFFVDDQESPARLRENLWRVELPEPRIGRIELRVEYVVPVPGEQATDEATLTAPILQAADAPFTTTRVRLGSLRLASRETGWQPRLARSGETDWMSTTQRSHVQLEIDDDILRVPQRFTVESAFVRTWFGEPGQANVYSEYVLRGAPHHVVVTLPASAVQTEFRWDGELLTGPNHVQGAGDEPGRSVILLPISEGEVATGRLSARYQMPQRLNPALVSRYEAEFPQFDRQVVVNATYWEVVLPPGMQLSAPPSGMAPQYTWERETVLWKRRPTEGYLEARKQAAQNEAFAAPSLPRGNTYAYGAIGVVSRGAVSGMAQSLIVLIGAGFSLLLGFVFRRIPATRNMLAVLVLGFLGTLAGLWRLELMQLLVQPALLGLLLAAVAASFDVMRDDRRRGDLRSTIDRSPSNSGHRAAAIPRMPAVPAQTAVFHPESGSESRRST